ncbi:NAD(P)/FAD-dependent oxidoreductase [Microbacterium sp. X-17]|uniref:FAD-dependent oxidoreductase n=1 Tax=Microbacterium sp. X-17 TaxID=3144404 RepID=UPI0031F4F0BB
MPEAPLPKQAEVVVIGAGPVGLLLGAELHRRGIDALVVERRETAAAGTRAIGVHAPALRALEPSGAAERLLAAAVRVQRGEARAGTRVLGTIRFDRLDTRFPFVATVPQAETEAAVSHGAPQPRRGTTVLGVAPHGDRMLVRTDRGDVLARIAVLAGGAAARGLAYRTGAIGVREYRDRYLMTDAAVGDEDPTAIVRLGRHGVLESFPLPGGGRRFVAWDPAPEDADPAHRRERLRAAIAAHGLDREAAHVASATGFRVRRAVAPRLRRGALLVIGDAAHEISPIGGQGMNLGILDAATLAPILAEWVRRGRAPEAALATWERRRVTSARRAAAIATLNTALGRPLGAAGDAGRRRALRILLAPPGARLFAHAYAMGFDRDA